MYKNLLFILFILLFSLNTDSFAETKIIKYSSYTLELNCETRLADAVYYSIGKDLANVKRPTNFKFDPNVDPNCQQKSLEPYAPKSIVFYDRGHLAAVNNLDDTIQSAEDTMFITNITPQTSSLNRGAWKYTENLEECLRESSTINVIAGTFYLSKTDKKSLQFYEKYGIITPSHFYKIIYTTDKAIAWFFPNEKSMDYKKANEYLISIHDLEKNVKRVFNIPEMLKKKSENLGSDFNLNACSIN